MEKKPRLIGIDLLRGIAIYAVVTLHSDEGILVQPPIWTAITQFAGFAVPFFLATSFYLTTDRLYTSARPYNLKSRLTRLLVPYGIWSILYLLYKTFKYTLKHDFDKLLNIFQDPVAIIFLGGAAFHLYFLPLLVSGTVLLKLTEFLIKYKPQIKYLILFFILSLIAYQWLLGTANSFRLDLNTAFQSVVTQNYLANNPAIRLFLVWSSWFIRCTPYIFLATIFNHQSIKEKLLKFANNNLIGCCIGFIIFNIYGQLSFPESIYEVLRGYAALLVAISLSTKLKENYIISNLSTCSFGIYLVHLLVVEFFQSVGKRIYPHAESLSTTALLAFSLLNFVISWTIVFYLTKQKSLANLLFGA